MSDLIDTIDNYTNNEASEGVAQASFMALVISVLIYCVALLG